MKDIKVMTMVRDDRFLPKWVEYYGGQLGMENLYVFFDGEDQQVPDFCAGVNTEVLPKMQGDVVATLNGGGGLAPAHPLTRHC